MKKNRHYLVWHFIRDHRHKGKELQPKYTVLQAWYSWAGSFLGIWLLASLSAGSRYPLIAAPMGATAVLVFGMPHSPLSQPKNVVVGNLLGGLLSILLVTSFGKAPWVVALAVSVTIMLMKLIRCVHPPAGAVALVGVMSGASWGFLLAPVLLGSLLIVLVAIVFNALIPGRVYPQHWL